MIQVHRIEGKGGRGPPETHSVIRITHDVTQPVKLLTASLFDMSCHDFWKAQLSHQTDRRTDTQSFQEHQIFTHITCYVMRFYVHRMAHQ